PSVFVLAPPPSVLHTLSLHDALPIFAARVPSGVRRIDSPGAERELRRTAGARHGRRRGRVSAGPIHEREPTVGPEQEDLADVLADRKSTRLNSSHVSISYAVFCLKKK